MDDTLISVVVPVYRPGAFLEEAIRSVIGQALPPRFRLELIAVLDGPDEEAINLLRKLHPSAVILTHPENRGPSAARNTGIRSAKGRYITFIDADDVWAPNRVLRDIEVLEGAEGMSMPDAVMSLHQIIRQNEEGQWIHSQLDWIFLMGVGMYRREVFDQVGLFDEALFHGEDSDWFLRLWEKEIRFRLRWEVSLLYRVHEGGMTWNKTIGEKGHLQAIKRSLDRRRSDHRAKAKDLTNPDPSLPLANRASDPGRMISILRHALRERWRYFGSVLPVSLICPPQKSDSEFARSCRQIIELPQETAISWQRLISRCTEPFIAIEIPGTISHPLRLREMLAYFELFPQTDVSLSSHLNDRSGKMIENRNPEISSFLARTGLMNKVSWEVETDAIPQKAMLSLFCEWRKVDAEIRILPWPLTAQSSSASPAP